MGRYLRGAGAAFFLIAAKVAAVESGHGHNAHYGEHRITIADFPGGKAPWGRGTFAPPWGMDQLRDGPNEFKDT
jgi:hypothetical protein